MDGVKGTIGAKGLNTGLRALFCVCLLFLATAPGSGPKGTRAPTESPIQGMTAPPTPLLEPGSRFGAFGGLERRFVGALPVAGGLQLAKHFYQILLLLTPKQPNLKPAKLAETQQWRLEGG